MAVWVGGWRSEKLAKAENLGGAYLIGPTKISNVKKCRERLPARTGTKHHHQTPDRSSAFPCTPTPVSNRLLSLARRTVYTEGKMVKRKVAALEKIDADL